jgi:hypothetical protein
MTSTFFRESIVWGGRDDKSKGILFCFCVRGNRLDEIASLKLAMTESNYKGAES